MQRPVGVPTDAEAPAGALPLLGGIGRPLRTTVDTAIATGPACLTPVIPTTTRREGSGPQHVPDAERRRISARGHAGRSDTVLRVAVSTPFEGAFGVAPRPQLDEGQVVPWSR